MNGNLSWTFGYEGALDENSDGSCRLCGLLTSKHCNRCGDYYCSEKCQYADWPNHRYICFPIPPLVRTRQKVHEDEIFSVNPPSLSGKHMTEVGDIFETIMKKLQFIEKSINNKNIYINGAENRLNETNDLDEPQELKNAHNSSQGSVTVQYKSPRNLAKSPLMLQSNLTNTPRVSKTANINCSRESLNNSLPESTVSTAQSENVFLCAFRSTNRCAIRSKNPEADDNFRIVLENIDAYGRSAAPLKTLPKVGEYAITLKSNTNYTRVKILSVLNDQKFRVLFCDYGNTVCRKLSDLREISDEMKMLPEYVSTVQLHGVKMSKYSDKIIEFLKSFERKEYKAKYINNNENTLVELYDVESNELLNEVVANFCSENEKSSKEGSVHQLPHLSNSNLNHKTLSSESSTEPEDRNTIEVVMSPPFQTHIFTENTINIKAVVVDTELVEYGYMACVQKTDMENLWKVQNFLNTTELGQQPYEPKLNEYCVAQFENQWYRGLVVNILDGGKKFDISYIDFLNEATLTSDCIRPYPKDLKIDCYTTLCKIDGLPDKLNNKHREFLKSEINVNNIISIDCVKDIIEKNIVLIQCNEIINRMRAQNLL